MKIYTITEAAELLESDLSWVWRLVKRYELGTQHGQMTLLTSSDIAKLRKHFKTRKLGRPPKA